MWCRASPVAPPHTASLSSLSAFPAPLPTTSGEVNERAYDVRCAAASPRQHGTRDALRACDAQEDSSDAE